ncbi:hypothetical protein [Mycobacterium sp. NPDC050853]|uniref:hypothetical protein n=1 Tax=Mycobacterium sp. NPDC050853 TaxID=3155160 RepID=UPI0033FDD43C
MKAYGNPPVYEQRGHVEYPKVTEGKDVLSRTRHAAVEVFQERRTALAREKTQAWLDYNPDSIERWPTKFGTVAAWGGFRVYYGTCPDCGGLVTSRKKGICRSLRGDGRWPKYCLRCREARRQAHDDGARRRVRTLRAKRSAMGCTPGSDTRYYRERKKAMEHAEEDD